MEIEMDRAVFGKQAGVSQVDHLREKYPSPVPGRVMIIVAGGSSARFGSDKLMIPVAGMPLLAHTVAAVRDHVDQCIVACRADQTGPLAELDLGVTLVVGGPTRTASEVAALRAVGASQHLIGIHDGARPLVSSALVETLFFTADRVGGAVPVVAPSYPLVTRSDLVPVPGAMIAQTPQVFRADPMLTAYAEAERREVVAHDTAEIVMRFGGIEIEAVPGDPANLKVTTPEDLELIKASLEPSRNGPR